MCVVELRLWMCECVLVFLKTKWQRKNGIVTIQDDFQNIEIS